MTTTTKQKQRQLFRRGLIRTFPCRVGCFGCFRRWRPPPARPSLARSLARSYLPRPPAPAASGRPAAVRPCRGVGPVPTRPRPRPGRVVTTRSRRTIARHAPPASLARRNSCRLVALRARRDERDRETRGRRRELLLGEALRSAGEAGRGSASAAEHVAGTARERRLRLRGVNSKIKPQFDARRGATRPERDAERPSAPARCSSTRSCAAQERDAGHTLRHG